VANVRLEAVSKRYGARAVLRDLSVEVRDGECFTFLGPSGCGKTVVLRLVAGFERPEAGEIHIGDALVSAPGRDLFVPPERRRIGVVFQDYAVWPHMTVLENVGYPLRMQRIPAAEAAARAREAVALVNLGGLEARLPFQLSGGQQQRVALARALVSSPRVMLLDEPLSNLDANLREEMRFELKELQRRTGVTILYVTHDQEVALAISDRVAVMDGDGAIRQIGAPDEVYERPADGFVFQFMGVCNFIPLAASGGRVVVRGSDVAVGVEVPPERREALRAGTLVVGCRPGDVRLLPDAGGTRAVVRRAVYLGPLMDYRLALGPAELRVQEEIQHALARGRPLREGDAVGLELQDLKWFPGETPAAVRARGTA
jgi:iron(III) transport system ATP-binding protein